MEEIKNKIIERTISYIKRFGENKRLGIAIIKELEQLKIIEKCKHENQSFDYDIGGFVCDDCNERCY